MREHSRDYGRLEDILKYAQNVETIVSGITYGEFVKDIRIYYSVMKNVEVIGEAANMLTRHCYAQISDTDLWQTATNDIKPLREQVQRYLVEIDWRKWNQGEDPYTEMDNAAYKQAVNSARKMKVKGYAIEDIIDITGLSIEEIEAL